MIEYFKMFAISYPNVSIGFIQPSHGFHLSMIFLKPVHDYSVVVEEEQGVRGDALGKLEHF